MSTSDDNNFPENLLSPNGWIAMVILSVFTFGVYYFFVFPKLVDQKQTMFYQQFKVADENTQFQMEANIPKNFSDFQESKLTLNITCMPANSCSGLLTLVSFSVEKDGKETSGSHVTLRRLDLKEQPAVVRNLFIKYDLKAYEIMSVPISVQIPNRKGEKVAFSVYVNQSKELAVKWDDSTCKTDYTWICASIDSGKALQQSAVENLLLPPWSNRLIPFIPFAMVWLAEQVIHKQKLWSEQPPNVGLLCLAGLGAYYLFLFYAILYFMLLADKPLAALLFAVILVLHIITLPKIFSSLEA